MFFSPYRIVSSEIGIRDVEGLVCAGNDVNKPDDTARVPLNYAIDAGRLDVVKYLVGAGARADVPFSLDTTFPPIVQSAALNRFDILRYLVLSGANVNAVDEEDNTPLLFACWHNTSDAISLLLDHRADCRVVNRYGETALRVAAERCSGRSLALMQGLLDK